MSSEETAGGRRGGTRSCSAGQDRAWIRARRKPPKGSPTALPCGDGSASDPANLKLVDWQPDSKIDISDAVATLTFLFLGNPAQLPCGDGSGKDPANLLLLDWQPDGRIDISDAVALLTFCFLGGSPHALAVPGAPSSGCVRIVGCSDHAGCR